MAIEELGRYKIEGKLGEGAMGVVYRARDPLLDRVVAIKTIRLELSADEQVDFERRFFREAKSIARLNHPAIVTIFDAGKVGNIAYMAMELLDGQDLRQLAVVGETMPYERIAEIVARVAEGLDYAHRNGVVHRDVKPANIFVLNDGQVKIADFGVAHLQTSSMTMTGMIVGTPRYMSPEQITGIAIDGRSDVFSLGVVLYQLLTRVLPFDGSSVTNIMYRVLHEPALKPTRLAADIPPGFEVILARALAKDPNRRYANAQEMATDLLRYRDLANSPVPAWQDGGLGDGGQAAWSPVPGSRSVASQDSISVLSSDPTLALPMREGGDTVILNQTSAASASGAGAVAMPDATLPPPLPTSTPTSLPPPLPPPVVEVAPQKTSGKVVWAAVAAGAVVLVAAVAWLALRPAVEGGQPSQPAPSASPPVPSQPSSAENRPQPPVAEGTLSFAVTPWGEVLVDGQPKGVTPPLQNLKLGVGKHSIEIRNGTAAPYRQEVVVEAGQTVKIKYKF